ncbi:SDR family oxidoreductase [Mesorhizobium sp. ES1-4]|uniref:SDR family oxidoreductase n=1 Tax=Mesorhizobium sp. ES1-4 TaxID=2876627 RepID=UPI001CCB53DB|nr:SDR family oxidoreductase [Mesorhizobium sp. ES1-4]MBZ9796929.1 SDR family oxidoreductase [Mesorhizobium sp. ES1-4]
MLGIGAWVARHRGGKRWSLVRLPPGSGVSCRRIRSAVEEDVIGRTALGRVGAPADAAAVALFLLSDEAAYVTSSRYLVDGGLTMA